jgi:hypothetical protein
VLHSSLEELTRAVRGLAPAPDHVELCADCLETVDRLREERNLFLRLPAPPPAGFSLRGLLRRLFGKR